MLLLIPILRLHRAAKMRMVFRVIGGISLGMGVLLCLLGAASLPAGGLMFALPFFFLMPGIGLVLFGGLLLFFTRLKGSTHSETRDTELRHPDMG